MGEGFRAFLEEYGVAALAIAVVIGAAVSNLVNTVVEGMVMPLIGVVLPGGGWRDAMVPVASAQIQVGQLTAAALDFLIIVALVYLAVTRLMDADRP